MALPRGPVGVEWRRHARVRRIGLRIDAGRAVVVVTMPARQRREAGLAFLVSQADWVADRLAALPRAVVFEDGVSVTLGDRVYAISHVPGLGGDPLLCGQSLLVGGESDLVGVQVRDFLCREARRVLSVRVAEKAGRLAVHPRRVLMKDTRTRWGSCAADGTLSFSWRLVMSPAFVQDYVTGHEVAHLRHMDHGAAFWGLVGKLSPHRAAAVAWLDSNGPRLLRQGHAKV